MSPPRYPVYIPSKDRADVCYTAKFLLADRVPFKLVVEPSQFKKYAAHFDEKDILVLPKDGMRLLGSRNWIRDHSIANGFDRHWQLDDNIRYMMRRYRARRFRCDSNVALSVCEDLTDRYSNVGLSGLNYAMFVPDRTKIAPFFVNNHVYSCSLINNRIPIKWRLYYNDDTDLCLQMLAGGYCTILVNAFMVQKIRTMVVKGGNTKDLYQSDGRLTMARALERVWPYVVSVDRRFNRPQHIVRDEWKKFDTQLKRRTDIDWSKFSAVDDYGLELKQVGEEVKSEYLRSLIAKPSRSAPKK